MILKLIIGAVIGAGLGLLYYKTIGCSTGTCPITSTPLGSGLYGAVFGALIGSMV